MSRSAHIYKELETLSVKKEFKLHLPVCKSFIRLPCRHYRGKQTHSDSHAIEGHMYRLVKIIYQYDV
jgi:hypothetical protein